MNSEAKKEIDESLDILTFTINPKSDWTPLRFVSEAVYQDFIWLKAKERRQEKERFDCIQKIQPEADHG